MNRNPNIPTNPNVIYKNSGWVNMGDFLGTGKIANQLRKYRSYEDAKLFVHKLGLKKISEWLHYSKSENKPKDIPANPSVVYKNKGWKGNGDWLGTGTVASFLRVFRPFKDARIFVRSLKLKNDVEWKLYCKSGKKPSDIPSEPKKVYKDKGYLNLGDWLGTGNIAGGQKK